MSPIDSIPHASSSGSGHNNGQKIISISPTNSTSPVNKESGLANDANTKVPEYEHSPRSEEETTEEETIGKDLQEDGKEMQIPVNKSGLAKDENTKVPLEYEQFPRSGEETVVEKATETT